MLYDSHHRHGGSPRRRIEDLLAQSSFGTPGATAVRAATPAPDGEHVARRAHNLAHGPDPRLHHHYADRLRVSDQAIASDRTPEFAYRTPGSADNQDWQLSWLPGRRLTHRQALLGVLLDDLLSNLDLVHDTASHDLALGAAAGLGIDVHDAVVALAGRTAARLHGLHPRDTVTTGAHTH
ncbi:hypothetical protein ACFXHA_02570 [Nocardia sp. NPDC059240]|uniref:hypothetical protein n=1 Tax=Nocardia sp. NPDC059240 TaxID=3346786 RepID=UPI0036B6C472